MVEFTLLLLTALCCLVALLVVSTWAYHTKLEQIEKLKRDRLLLALYIHGVTPDENTQSVEDAERIARKVNLICIEARGEAKC